MHPDIHPNSGNRHERAQASPSTYLSATKASSQLRTASSITSVLPKTPRAVPSTGIGYVASPLFHLPQKIQGKYCCTLALSLCANSGEDIDDLTTKAYGPGCYTTRKIRRTILHTCARWLLLASPIRFPVLTSTGITSDEAPSPPPYTGA